MWAACKRAAHFGWRRLCYQTPALCWMQPQAGHDQDVSAEHSTLHAWSIRMCVNLKLEAICIRHDARPGLCQIVVLCTVSHIRHMNTCTTALPVQVPGGGPLPPGLSDTEGGLPLYMQCGTLVEHERLPGRYCMHCCAFFVLRCILRCVLRTSVAGSHC